MLRSLLLLVLLAPRATAGAWPLPAGEGHLSVSVEGDRGDGTGAYSTLYLEHGLAGGRTAGLDLGLSEAEVDKAVAFLRWHGGADDGTRLAYELGAGKVDDHAALRPGLSLGRGVAFGERTGWVALDTRAVLFDDMALRLEADLTVGGDAGTGDKWLVQVQMAAPSDAAPYVKLAPGYAFGMGAGRHLRVGVTAGLVGLDAVKLDLGLWQRF
jgi:hypothetical protein